MRERQPGIILNDRLEVGGDLFTWPFRHIHLDGFAGKVEYAQLLSDASEIKMLHIDPQQRALYTTMGGQKGVLPLELPVH